MTDYTGPKAIGFRGPAAAVITKLFGNCVATIGCFYRATTDMNPLHTNSESKIMLRNNSKNQYPKAFMHQADLAAAQLLEHKLYRGRNERGTTDGATPLPPEIGNRYRHSNFDKTTIFIRALKASQKSASSYALPLTNGRRIGRLVTVFNIPSQSILNVPRDAAGDLIVQDRGRFSGKQLYQQRAFLKLILDNVFRCLTCSYEHESGLLCLRACISRKLNGKPQQLELNLWTRRSRR